MFKNPWNVLPGDVHREIDRPIISLLELQPSTKPPSVTRQACSQTDRVDYGCKLRCSLRTGEQGDASNQSTCTDMV